jgi:membrane peptidoglycan carboxypeptidase
MAEPRPSRPLTAPGSAGVPRESTTPRKRASAAKPAGWRPGPWWPRHRGQWLRLIGIVAAVCLLLVLGMVAYAAATLPDPSKLDLAAGSIQIVDRHGAVIEERNSQGVAVQPVKLDQISPLLQNATIAVEDKSFYHNFGIDWGRLIKAGFIDTITRRPQQGASTIAEQLAKIAVIQSPKKSLFNKLREAMIAVELESRYSKKDILTMYLNSIYYGHQATGIEAASQVYFGIHASQLNLAQASMLAGLPNGPSLYDPQVNLPLAKDRQAIVLDAMVRQNMISAADAQQAQATPLNFVFRENRSSQAPHFVDYVMNQLDALYGANAVNHGGFVVTTTLDLNLQKAAEHAVAVGQQRLGPLGADNGDFIAVDPKTGQILAMVGSADYTNDTIHGQYNVVTSPRQPGSSFKVYAYEQAFRSHKLTMGNLLDDTSRHFANGQFHDFDFQDMGMITAHKALLLSRNIPALETMQLAGITNVTQLAHQMGITTPLKDEVTTAIGSSEVTLLDQAIGYSVFADGGVRHAPSAILQVKDLQGNVLDTPSSKEATQVLTAQEAYLITYILKGYPDTWDLGWNKPFAGKSGTTNNFHDAWMMGYSANLVIGAWVGNTAGSGANNMNGVYGTMVGSSVLRDFIDSGLSRANFHVEAVQQPSGLISGPPCGNNDNINPSPSASSSSSSSSRNVGSERELYLPGTQCTAPAATPTTTHSATPSPSPSPAVSVSVSVSPSVLPSLTPSASASSSAAPSPSGGAASASAATAPSSGGG